MTASQSPSVILNSRLSRRMPALLTSTVGAPSSSATRFTTSVTCSESLTSSLRPKAFPPPATIFSAPSQHGLLVEVEQRDGEAVAASRWATAAPMPRAAPVTMATLSATGSSFVGDGELSKRLVTYLRRSSLTSSAVRSDHTDWSECHARGGRCPWTITGQGRAHHRRLERHRCRRRPQARRGWCRVVVADVDDGAGQSRRGRDRRRCSSAATSPSRRTASPRWPSRSGSSAGWTSCS